MEVLRRGFRGELEKSRLEELIVDEESNRSVFDRVSSRCYIPATKMLLRTSRELRRQGFNPQFSFSISGIFIEQARRYAPQLLDILRDGVADGFFDVVEQTYFHSLASLLPDHEELAEQIQTHRATVEELFGVKPKTVENTEMIYNNDIANLFYELGYEVVLTEGVDWVLGGRSPCYVYRAWGSDIRILLRNYRLSDDVGFRFSSRSWDQYPLTADKYVSWLEATPGHVIFIGMDYETFGEHHPPETGILNFLEYLPKEIAKRGGLSLRNPLEVAKSHSPVDIYDVPPWSTISWADERDLSAWLGNEMQQKAFSLYKELEPYVKAVGGDVLRTWRLLGTSDHYYYMATKAGSTGEVHRYFSPYKSPILAFETFIEVLTSLSREIAYLISENPRYYVKKIRLPRCRAFRFYLGPGNYLGLYARSLEELATAIQEAPPESLVYHLRRRDLQAWLRTQFFLDEVADMLDSLPTTDVSSSELRRKTLNTLKDVIS